jgi:trans-aconitate methyltransferase
MADHPATHGDDWTAYFDAVAGLPARETLIAALERFESEQSREREQPASTNGRGIGPVADARGSDGPFAIDLGCGDGRDTLELLRRGWRVLAIDNSREALSRLATRVTDPRSLQARLTPFESTPLPGCDLVNASFSIPHCSPADFPSMWARIVGAIRPGGRFAGQLFGIRDEWATKPDGVTRTYHSREQVEAMLAPFEVELLDEVQRPGKNALGQPKYWHVFHIVARKR